MVLQTHFHPSPHRPFLRYPRRRAREPRFLPPLPAFRRHARLLAPQAKQEQELNSEPRPKRRGFSFRTASDRFNPAI